MSGLSDQEIQLLLDEIERLHISEQKHGAFMDTNTEEVQCVKDSIEGLVKAQFQALVEKNQKLQEELAEAHAAIEYWQDLADAF
jgi:hypothetical protein